jgi:mercuric ion binding protein
MKKLIILLMFAGSFVSSNLYAAEKTVVLAVPRMYCSVCPITVKRALLGVDGVKSVSDSLQTKTATVTYDDQKASVAKLISATTNSGYPSTLKK